MVNNLLKMSFDPGGDCYKSHGCRFVPLYIFGNKPPQMVPSRISKILETPGFGGLIQGQIYNPDTGWMVDPGKAPGIV